MEILKKEMIKDIVKINQFAHLNQTAIRKIIKKHDKVSKKLFPAWRHRIVYKTYKQMFSLLNQISDLYKNNETKLDIQIDQQNFVRKSHKYWVRPENVVELISVIIKKLPIYTFDKDAEMLGQIDSVYFDNSEHFCYNTRLVKKQGSKLVRLRWYNDNMDNIFVERKVHNENWTLQESEKNRFILLKMIKYFHI